MDPDDDLARAGDRVGPLGSSVRTSGPPCRWMTIARIGIIPQARPGTASSAATTASPTAAVVAGAAEVGREDAAGAGHGATAASIARPRPWRRRCRRAAEPLEQEPGREDGRHGIRDALAGDVRRRPVRRLEEAVVVADVSRRRHAEAAHGGGGEVRGCRRTCSRRRPRRSGRGAGPGTSSSRRRRRGRPGRPGSRPPPRRRARGRRRSSGARWPCPRR